jgi:excisionase family DNA binding protein
MLSAKEAATAVGMSKNGIIRAIHSGRLSATRSEGGQFEIDPAELFRVYDPVSTTDHLSWEVAGNETPAQSDDGVNQVAMLERIIRSHEETIADLRGQLAATTALATQLSAVIAQVQPPKAKPGWWARLLGGA